MGEGKLIDEATQGIVDPVVIYNPLSLEGTTHLQMLHHRCGMVTLMFAAPASVADPSRFPAERKSGLLPGVFRRGGHVLSLW